MPHIADLSEYGRFGGADPGLIAVGWLDAGHEHPKGPRTAEVDAMLGRLSTSWSPVKTCGSHRCELCTTSEPPTYASGIILVPWGKLIYIAPAMINHYLRDHQHAPPREFINAVLAGPVIGSRSYFQAIINSGRNQTVVECASIQLAELEERIRSHGQR